MAVLGRVLVSRVGWILVLLSYAAQQGLCWVSFSARNGDWAGLPISGQEHTRLGSASIKWPLFAQQGASHAPLAPDGAKASPRVLTRRTILNQNVIRCRDFSIDNHKTFSFVASYNSVDSMPIFPVPEIALVGRSNVGKSSLINCLSGLNKPVAVRSKQPGRTQTMNLFTCTDRERGDICIFADLPGYGYAKISKRTMHQISAFVDQYLCSRQSLMCTVLLVDARLEPQESDLAMARYLNDIGNPFAIVATKMDKAKKSDLAVNLEKWRQALDLPAGQPLPFSATTGEGKRQLWACLKDAILARGAFSEENFQLIDGKT